MNIVYLSSEVVPFAKTGGLADVCGALPREVAALGHRCHVIMPAFPSTKQTSNAVQTTNMSFAVPMSPGKLVGCRVLQTQLPDSQVPVWLLDQPQYFDRPSLYGDAWGDYKDNAERFAFFSRAAIMAMELLPWPVDVVHCNDWQTGIVPALLKARSPMERPRVESPSRIGAAGHATSSEEPFLGRGQIATSDPLANATTVLTVHNLAYQGEFPAEQFPWTGLGWDHFLPESFEFYGRLNFLKTGVVCADEITTVSPTYAKEITTSLHGCGLDPILRGRQDRLTGIINGVDNQVWNPSTDSHLFENYDVESWVSGKAANKRGLQSEVGLPIDSAVPLMGLVGRLASQKGWNMILPIIERHLKENRPTQWVVLGSGDESIAQPLKKLSEAFPQQLAVYLGFSNALAHRIEAGADLFIMPSLYEPCGLNQLYSMIYGTPCVVTSTGGLVDTIVDANAETIAAGTATGFHMDGFDAEALDRCINRALHTRYHHPTDWQAIATNGMRQDWSWRSSAQEYLRVYGRSGPVTCP
ncbi:MAG: glycogen/starch synthase [Planctomycetota bacterium]